MKSSARIAAALLIAFVPIAAGPVSGAQRAKPVKSTTQRMKGVVQKGAYAVRSIFA